MNGLVALALQAIPSDSLARLDSLIRADSLARLELILRADSLARVAGSADTLLVDVIGKPPSEGVDLLGVIAICAGIASIVAAIASWRSASAAQEANDHQKEGRQAERRYFYYNAIVATPIFDAIQRHGDLLRSLLKTGASSIAGMHQQGKSPGDISEAVTGLLNGTFVPAHYDMTRALTEAAEAWPDPDLREAIRLAAEKAEAAVADEGINLLDPPGLVSFDAVLNEALGALRRVVMDHDPALKVEEMTAVAPNAASPRPASPSAAPAAGEPAADEPTT